MKKFLLIIFVSFFAVTNSQSVKVTSIDKEIVFNMFNSNWTKADSIIDVQLKNNVSNPKYHFMKAYNIFYARLLSGQVMSRDSSMMLTEHYAWKAIKIGEENEESVESKFYIGAAYSYLARINVMNQDFWTAYWNAGKAEDYLKEVLDDDPNNYDAHFAIGVQEYFPARFVTGFNGFLAWIGGMGGDSDEGLRRMTLTAENGSLFKDEAMFALGLIHRGQEIDWEKAYGYYKFLAAKYPNNNAFQNNLRQTQLAMDINNEGIELLENNFDQLVEKYGITNAFTLNGLGYSFMNQEKYDEALAIFRTNIKLYPIVANCYDSLAECYLTMGDNENAIKYYEMAYEKIPGDTLSNPQFLENLKTGIEDRLAELRANVQS